jgi:hypothetical protein
MRRLAGWQQTHRTHDSAGIRALQAEASQAVATGQELLAVSRQLAPRVAALQTMAASLRQVRQTLCSGDLVLDQPPEPAPAGTQAAGLRTDD